MFFVKTIFETVNENSIKNFYLKSLWNPLRYKLKMSVNDMEVLLVGRCAAGMTHTDERMNTRRQDTCATCGSKFWSFSLGSNILDVYYANSMKLAQNMNV